LRVIPAGRRRTSRTIYVLLAGALCLTALRLAAQTAAPSASADEPDVAARAVLTGLPVRQIVLQGIDETRAKPLRDRLPLQTGEPLTEEVLSRTLRQVYASGLFETVDVEGSREGDGVVLTFKGTPRTFVGTVSVYGARGATVNAQLDRANRLSTGTRFTKSAMDQALVRMREVLADNGYHEPTITYTMTPMPGEQLVDIAFQVTSGPQARIGNVELSGTAGMSVESFRRYGRLRTGSAVDRDTVSRALSGVLKYYQRHNRLEADVKLESQAYDAATKRINYKFTAARGPEVQLKLTGAGLDDARLKRAIPIYEEGTVDDDLLNEGDRRIRDYYQRLGYFDVKVEHAQQNSSDDLVTITYVVTLGTRRKVERVEVDGNHYFDSATIKDLLSVHPADSLDRHGAYSQALVTSDINALVAVYQNNGFSDIKVTSETGLAAQSPDSTAAKPKRKTAGLRVIYHVQEGTQQRVGTVTLDGNTHTPADKLQPLMNTAAGQLVSPQNLAGDRDALLTDYLSRGYEQAQVEVEQKARANDPNLLDVTFHITEGQQVFVRKVLLTGLHYTRPDTVTRAITLHPGDPLDQSALLETQRKLYEFALFNEVDTAVQNPGGTEPWKTVLVQTSEARRWTLTYGFGFETQTGTPQNNCKGYQAATGDTCNPNGKPGISIRVLADVTRNNLFGRDQSASIQGTYGLLEQKINLVYQNPHFLGHPNFGLSFTGGYANSQDVTTYVASKLNAGLRMTEHFTGRPALLSRANTLVYFMDFRRVKVQGSSLQVYPAAISELAAAVRVAGPGLTWLRDTRDSPLDAHRGTYTSFQEFVSGHKFGSQAQFNRLDVSNSNFWSFDKSRFVLARNSRYAQERAYGENSDELIPLPERLYSGGSTSLRGFSVNAAGPRDPETGFPIGGAGALVNSTELRLPPPTLPWFGNSVSFVLFHDMGNVFRNAGDAWESALRVRQPDRDACRVLTPPTTDPTTGTLTAPAPSGTPTSTGVPGACSFNYFSHAAGLGVRYHTPIGPIRLDFSYNLNPPIYPVNIDYSHSNPYDNQHVGQADHFNFFFSLGQTF